MTSGDQGIGGRSGRTRHHYVLAHIALRQACFSDPLGFFALVANGQGPALVGSVWEEVCRNCDQDGEAGFSAKDVQLETTGVGAYPAILVKMPEPQSVAEAYLLCLVLQMSADDLERPGATPTLRYFTLEKAMGPGGTGAVLCAWTEEGHVNYGPTAVRNTRDFLDAVEKLI